MIHICRVDTSCRHIFDSDNGINDVQSLKEAIEAQYQIAKNKQILLIGGGEVLDNPAQKLYGLSAGREESPIYLIDKSNVEREQPPIVENPFLENIKTFDMRQEIDAAIALKPSYQTLKTRTDLANKLNNLGKYLSETCKSFYDDQYWQYQGFLALVANLDEYVSDFRKKVEQVREQFGKYQNEKVYYRHLMNEIDKYIDILSQIRLLPQMILASPTSPGSHTTNMPLHSFSSIMTATNTSTLSSPRSHHLHHLHQQQRGHPAKLFSSFSSQSLSNLQQHVAPPPPHSPTQPPLLTQPSSSNDAHSLKRTATLPLTASPPSAGGLPGASSLEVISEFAATATGGGNSVSGGPSTFPELLSGMSTLLEWIKSTDSKNKLTGVIGETREILHNSETQYKWVDLDAKIGHLLAQIEQSPYLREIEGLAKRLFDLNAFLEKTRVFVIAQNEIAQSFAANQSRAQTLRDESVLPDLCKAHEQQLELLKTNHTQMIEITSKINRAKLELIKVIHQRLNVIMKMQRRISDLGFQLEMYFKQLRRLNVRLRLMESLKRAPQCYFLAVREISRRKKFSKTYKRFATLLHALVLRVHRKETQRRIEFDARMSPQFAEHFILSILFAGLGDKVELFLSDVSAVKFDVQLGLLDDQDMERLERELIDQFAEWAPKFLSVLQQPLQQQLSPQRSDSSSNNPVTMSTTTATTTSAATIIAGISTSSSGSSSSGGAGAGGSSSSSDSSSSSSTAAADANTTTTTPATTTAPTTSATSPQFFTLSSSPPLTTTTATTTTTMATSTPNKNQKEEPEQFVKTRLGEEEAFWREVLQLKEGTTATPAAILEDAEMDFIERIIELFVKAEGSTGESGNQVEEKEEVEEPKPTEEEEKLKQSNREEGQEEKETSPPPPRHPATYAEAVQTNLASKGINESSKALLTEIRTKLNDSKHLLSDYQQELLDTIRSLTAQQHTQNDKLRDATQMQLRDLHGQVLASVRKLFAIAQTKEADDEEEEDAAGKTIGELIERETRRLSDALLELLGKRHAEHAQRLDELQATLKSVKTNANAEKQIAFNEAIRRVAQDKERAVDELKAREAALLEQVRALEERQRVAEETAVKARLVQDAQLEKIGQLERQLASFSTLPVTTSADDAIQLHSCNIGDLVAAVFSREHQSYRVVNRTSSYLHFVHSAVYKPATGEGGGRMVEQRLATPSRPANNVVVVAATETTGGAFEDLSMASIVPMTAATPSLEPTPAEPPQPPPQQQANTAPPEVMYFGENQVFFGRVIAKEFCIAKKENNRFKVQIGTRFYRVKLKPFSINDTSAPPPPPQPTPALQQPQLLPPPPQQQRRSPQPQQSST